MHPGKTVRSETLEALDAATVDDSFAAMEVDPNDLGRTADVSRSQERILLDSLAGEGTYLNLTGEAAMDASLVVLPIPGITALRLIQSAKAAKSVGTAVIGKMDDLAKASGWKSGDYLLLLNKNSSWADNRKLLNTIMENGRSIKDKSPFNNLGFLDKEHQHLLKSGWKQIKKDSDYLWVK